MITSSVLCYFIFLIIAGGIIVTFLFFLVFINVEFIEFSIYIFVIRRFLIVLRYFIIFKKILVIDFSWEIGLTYLDLKDCYFSLLGLSLTFFCIIFLLYIIYVSVKVSTYLKSSPIRKLNYEKFSLFIYCKDNKYLIYYFTYTPKYYVDVEFWINTRYLSFNSNFFWAIPFYTLLS